MDRSIGSASTLRLAKRVCRHFGQRQRGTIRDLSYAAGVNSKQFYWSDTNVLVTRFLSPSGVGEIEDFMPAGLPQDSLWHDQLIRPVKVMRGSMEFSLRCHLAFD